MNIINSPVVLLKRDDKNIEMSTNNTNMLQYINTKSLVFGCLDFAIQQEQ